MGLFSNIIDDVSSVLGVSTKNKVDPALAARLTGDKLLNLKKQVNDTTPAVLHAVVTPRGNQIIQKQVNNQIEDLNSGAFRPPVEAKLPFIPVTVSTENTSGGGGLFASLAAGLVEWPERVAKTFYQVATKGQKLTPQEFGVHKVNTAIDEYKNNIQTNPYFQAHPYQAYALAAFTGALDMLPVGQFGESFVKTTLAKLGTADRVVTEAKIAMGFGPDEVVTPESLKKAYLRTATVVHPDAGGTAEAFSKLGTANETLAAALEKNGGVLKPLSQGDRIAQKVAEKLNTKVGDLMKTPKGTPYLGVKGLLPRNAGMETTQPFQQYRTPKFGLSIEDVPEKPVSQGGLFDNNLPKSEPPAATPAQPHTMADISPEMEAKAQVDWQDNYAENYANLSDKASKLEGQLKTARASEKYPLQAQITDLNTQMSKMEEDFVGKYLKSGPTVIDADKFKEQFNDYNPANRQKYSDMAQKQFEEAVKADPNPVIKMTAGGPGSGKSEILIPEMSKNFNGVIADSPHSYLPIVQKRIEQIVKAGKKFQIRVLIRDLKNARYFTLLREKETGRGVALHYFINKHMELIDTYKKLLSENLDADIKVKDLRNITNVEEARKSNFVTGKEALSLLNSLNYDKVKLYEELKNLTIENYDTSRASQSGVRTESGTGQGNEAPQRRESQRSKSSGELSQKNGTNNGIETPKDDFMSFLEETMAKDKITPKEEQKLSEIEQYQQEELQKIDAELQDYGAFDFQGQQQPNYERFVQIVKDPSLLNSRSKEIIQSGDVTAFKKIAENVKDYNSLKEDIFGYSDKNDDEMFELFRERLIKENPNLLSTQYAGRPTAKTRIKVALGRRKRIIDMKALAEKIVRKATIKEVPIKKLLKPEPPNRITKTETSLLKEKIKNQARGAWSGYQSGKEVGQAQQKNIQGNAKDKLKKQAEMKLLKEGIKIRASKDKIILELQNSSSESQAIKTDIVKEITATFPVSERGKFINMVKNAKTRKDLVKAYLRINDAEEALKLKLAIGDLKKTVDNLSDSPAISADYRNKIEDIVDQYELSGHNEETLDRLKATQKYLDTSKANGVETELPQRILEKLKILTRVPKDQLTLNQVQGLKAEIELLGKLGETKWSSKEALYDAEKEARMNALLENASSIDSKVLPQGPIGSSPKKWVKAFIEARNYLQKSRIGLTPMDGVAEITGVEPMKKALDLSFGNYLTFNDKVLPQWHEITKDFDESNFKRIGTYAIAQQEGGAERLANSGITQQQIADLKLTPEEQKAYQFVLDTFDSNFPAVKKYALDTYNADVGQQKNYVSFMSDYTAMSDLEIYDRFGQRAQDMVGKRTKTVEQGFTKERAKGSTAQLETNIDKIFRRHMDDVAYMLTMGRDIKQYFEIINSPAMRAKLGDVGTMSWLQWLDLMARKGGVEGGHRIAWLDWFRKNLSMGVLAFRASSALVQFTTLADTAGTIGTEYTMKGATKIATSKEWRNFIMDNFPEIKKSVGDDVAFREFSDDWRAKVAGVGLKPLQALDGLMRSTAAAGSYMKFADEAGVAIDLANPDKELIQKATLSMRQSQGSSFFKDQPLAISAGYGITDNRSLNKTLFTFQSFMLNHWDNIQRQVWRMGIKEGNYKKAGMSFFWLVLVAAGLEEGIRRGIKKVTNLITDDHPTEQPFLHNALQNIIQSVPIAGSLFSSIVYGGTNPVPVVNTFEEIIKGIANAYTAKKPETKHKQELRAAGAAGTLFGLPGASQATQLLNKYLYPNVEKSTSASSGSITSKRTNPFKPTSAGRKNPFKASSGVRKNPFK